MKIYYWLNHVRYEILVYWQSRPRPPDLRLNLNIKTMSLEHHYFNQFANGRSILQIKDTRSECITLIGFSDHKPHLPSEKITNKLTCFYNRMINIAFDPGITMCILSYRYVVYNRLIISYRVFELLLIDMFLGLCFNM